MQLENNNTSAELTAQIEKTNVSLSVMQSQKSFLEDLRNSQEENLSTMLNMTTPDELNEYLNPNNLSINDEIDLVFNSI